MDFIFLIKTGESTRRAITYNPFDVKIGGKVFHGTYCQKMLGSRKLYAGYVAALREVAKLMSRPAHKIPKEEE